MGKISVDDRERIEVVTRMQECISKKNWVLQTDDEGNLRDKNKETLYTYNLDERSVEKILRSLTQSDCFYAETDEIKKGKQYEERMYIFSARRRLKNTNKKIKDVTLYIKIQFMKTEADNVLVISFHPAERELKRYWR